MNTVERAGPLPVPTELKRLRYQLQVEFLRFVGEQTGLDRLVSFPDFVLPDGSESPGAVNPEWVKTIQLINKHIGRGPGVIRYNQKTNEYDVTDPVSPIGQIAGLADMAKRAVTDGTREESQKRLESETRTQLTDIFNGYAGLRFNGVRDVVNGQDFRGVNLHYVASRSLKAWRQDLVATRQQFVEPALFERWDEANRKIQTPSQADQFVYTLFEELAQSVDNDNLSPEAQTLKGLLLYELPHGYLTISDLLYGGNMHKAYINLSAVSNMTGQRMPQGWQQFIGTTSEFRHLQDKLSTVTDGIAGYLETADRLYGGNMLKTYINLSAVSNMTGQRMPQGWQQFTGTTSEFRHLQDQLSTITGGIDGYLAAADLLYGGNMLKTYQNLSAVSAMTGQRMPQGWQAFIGTTTEFRHLQDQLSTITGGIDGYLEAADLLHGGDMLKTFKNLSAVSNMTGQRMPEGWQQFAGTTTEYQRQRVWLQEHPMASVEEFMAHFNIRSKMTGMKNRAAIGKMSMSSF